MAIFKGADGQLRELALFAGAGGGILGGKLLGWRTVCVWNGMPTQHPSWLPVKTTKRLSLSRSGMEYRLLTDDLGEAVLMSFLADFPCQAFSAAASRSKHRSKRHVARDAADRC